MSRLWNPYVALFAVACVAACSSDAAPSGGGPATVETSRTLAITGARVFRLNQAFGNTVINDLFNERPMLTSDGNLWHRTDAEGRVYTASFFTDPEGTASAGTIVSTASNDDLSFPVTFEGVVSTTAGVRPSTGNFTLSMSDNRHAHFVGDVTVRPSADSAGTLALEFDVTIDGIMETIDGSATAVGSDSTVSFTNLADGGRVRGYGSIMTASLRLTPGDVTDSVTVTLHDGDGAGSLVLGDGTRAEWDAAGAGTLTLPDGSTQPLVNVDRGL